jgi:hypothetical protein
MMLMMRFVLLLCFLFEYPELVNTNYAAVEWKWTCIRTVIVCRRDDEALIERV